MTDSDSDNTNIGEDNGLEDWLISNNLSKILQVLNDNDIEKLADFAALETKKDIEEFADDLQLKVIKRKKFIKAVLKLNESQLNTNTDISTPNPTHEPETSSDIFRVLLKQWKLGKYTKNFEDAGFDDISAWQELSMDELTNVLKMKYAHAKKFIKNSSTLVQKSSSDDAVRLLKEWKLERYIDIFQEEDYEDINDWQELTMDELTKVLKMKYAHAKKFIKNRATLIQNSSSNSDDNRNKRESKKSNKSRKKRRRHSRKTSDSESKSSEEEVSDAARFLKQWKLDRYLSVFIDEGYEDIDDWQELTMDELTNVLNMKTGHAKKFIKNRTIVVQNNTSSESDDNRNKRRVKKRSRSKKRKQTLKKRHKKTKNISESETKSSDEESSHISSFNEDEANDAVRFLKEWKLERYIARFKNEGYDDINIWQDLTIYDLTNELKMKSGHAKTFIKNCSKLDQTSVVLTHKRIVGNPGYSSDDTKVNSDDDSKNPECIPPPQMIIETNDQRLLRERKERRAANAHLLGNRNFVPTVDRNDHRKHKTIMVISETGTGKSTILNSMMNYLYEVEYKDKYRFKLIKNIISKNETVSQTDDVTTYVLSPPILDYDLTVIDTPGFGDTRGLAQDKIIIENIRKCFEEEISEINAICFVIRAPQVRLTASQEYIFNQVLGFFGADIKDNIFILITFADQKKPKAVAALKKANIPFVKYFKVNNSVFELPEDEESDDDEEDATGDYFGPLFWNMGMFAFKKLFIELDKVETKIRIMKDLIKSE